VIRGRLASQTARRQEFENLATEAREQIRKVKNHIHTSSSRYIAYLR
jgi:hypothetical protein